jgi:hypothetical protein
MIWLEHIHRIVEAAYRLAEMGAADWAKLLP